MPVFEPLRRRPLSPLAVVALASAVLGLVAPHSAGGSFAWSLASLTVLLGLGAGVRRALRLPASLGAGPGLSLLELFALGAAAWLAASGFLLAAGLASRLPLMVLAAAGLALGAWELATVAPAPRPAGAARSLESRLGIAALVALLTGYCALALLGALVTRGNPFDDHVAYTPFLKRLLEAGNLLEPFSYRRISSYGGQTVLQALVALRGNYESSDLLDRGIFHVVSLLGLIGLMQRRRFHVGVGAVLIFFVIALPEMSINSASGWTGLAMFLAAYAMATREDLAPRLRLPLVFACCAAACTLRQNFLLPAGLFAALLLLAHLAHAAKAAKAAKADDDGLPGLAARWRAALSAERTVALAAIATAAAIIIPYAFATWRSSGSFLYPILLGHMNPIAPTTPLGMTWFEKVAMVVLNGLSAEPIRVWWVILPIMLIARDPRPTQPWRWYLVSSVIGFVYLLQGFLVSDGMTLWRYAFGYVTPLALVLVIEVGDRLPLGAAAKQRGEPDEPGEPAPFRLRLPGFAIFLLWLALIAQLTDSRDKLLPRLLDLSQNLSAARAFGVDRHRGLARSYEALQQALPAGAKVAILLDDPYYLDYSRNDFQNLDLPGFAAPSLQPSFTEPERWRRYFLDHGVRYLAFVDLRKSTYLYRRAEWVRRLFLENELWRFMAAHIVDAGDTFLQLAATTKVLYLDREQGLYALDLSSPTTAPATAAPATAPASAGLDAPEPVRMDRFVRGLAEREYGSEAWRLVSRHDVIFLPDGGGPSGLRMAAPSPVRDGAEGLLSALFGAPASEPPHRWLNDRTHLRVLGDGSGAQRLRLALWVDVPRLTTTPKLSLVVGGEVLGETAPDATGAVSFDVAPRCSGWCDVYIIASALGEFWLDPEKNRVLKLTSLSWNEAPAASIREANRAP